MRCAVVALTMSLVFLGRLPGGGASVLGLRGDFPSSPFLPPFPHLLASQPNSPVPPDHWAREAK